MELPPNKRRKLASLDKNKPMNDDGDHITIEEGDNVEEVTPLQLFLYGQSLEAALEDEEEGEEEEEKEEEEEEEEEENQQHLQTPQEVYLQIFHNYKPKDIYKYKPRTLTTPPNNLIYSCACNSLGGFETDQGNIDQARVYFGHALKWWPENAMALVNSGNMERENGSIHKAMEHYMGCSNLILTPYHNVNEGEEQEDPYEWEDAWICSPREACVAKATYLCCLMLHQQERGIEANNMLQRFGIKFKVSDDVWKFAMNKNSYSITTKDHENIEPHESFVKHVHSCIPLYWSDRMRQIFRPSSPFWIETNYSERGYFSFWYDLMKEPSNVVEYIIQKYILTNCCLKEKGGKEKDDDEEQRKRKIIGAEWWVS
jgi:hypothetical protein